MLRRVAPVRTDVSEVLSASNIRVLTRATGCNIPGDGILHSHRRENLKSYREYRRLCLKKQNKLRACSGSEIRRDELLLSTCQILPAALGLGDYSTFKRNDCQNR
jgi:hypothetical protein